MSPQAARKALGMSRKQVGRLCKISASYVGQIERERFAPFHIAIRMANVYRLPPEAFIMPDSQRDDQPVAATAG